MFAVGLTGGIGSGKSTVADLFAKRGVTLVDTDVIAHRVTAPGGLAMPIIATEFGASFVRIHRNALVGVKYLERIERSAEGQYFVRLRGCEAPLQVSRRMAGELRERFRL